jgi:subfamily B ATP-binding cassette protein MsbA
VSTWRRLFGYVLPYKGALAAAGLCMVVMAVTTGSYPVLLDLLTTILIQGAGPEAVGSALQDVSTGLTKVGVEVDEAALAAFLVAHVVPLFGGVVALKALSQAGRFFAMGYLAQNVIRDLRTRLFEALVRQGAPFFGQQSTGHLVSRVMNDVAQVERAATYAIPVLVGDALRVLTLGAVCLVQYTELSLVAFVALPLAVLPIVQFGRMLKRYARRGQEAVGGLTHRITETLGGIRVVHTYGAEAHEVQRFSDANDGYVRVMMKSVLVRAVQTPAMELIGVLALLLTLGYAVGKVDSGEIRAGEVVGFLLAMVLLYEPIKAIGRLNGIIVPGLASAERVFEIMDRPADIVDRPGARALDRDPEVVRFEGVGFRYAEDGPWVLRGFDLVLPRGKMVALVGGSGGGKSTAAALLPRLYDVSEGAITVDGVDLRDLTQASLRARIALVSQENYLFNDTVRANIAYGRPGATDAEVEAAARRAYAHDFIAALPRGYGTVTGERGVQLSGGQRQRIAIARAFLRDAPILILDEATSALDTQSEQQVQQALDALVQDRTTLVIAHRLTTVRGAHEIVVLDHGRVVERGTHEALAGAGGLYARLVGAAEG